VLILVMAVATGGPEALRYAESRNYAVPLFVFVVMVIGRPWRRQGRTPIACVTPLRTGQSRREA